MHGTPACSDDSYRRGKGTCTCLACVPVSYSLSRPRWSNEHPDEHLPGPGTSSTTHLLLKLSTPSVSTPHGTISNPDALTVDPRVSVANNGGDEHQSVTGSNEAIPMAGGGVATLAGGGSWVALDFGVEVSVLATVIL